MKALKCKASAQFAYNYSINVLSKCSNIISHQSRSSKVDISIFEGRHIDLRKLTHRSPKVDTHRSSKVDTSIIDLRRSTLRSSKIKGGNIVPKTSLNIVRSIIPEDFVRYNIRRSYTHPLTYVYTATATPRVIPHVH